MIGINDQSDREYACVRQDLEVNSHVPTLADSDRNGSTDLVPAKQDRPDGAADVRHECGTGAGGYRRSLPRSGVVTLDPFSRARRT